MILILELHKKSGTTITTIDQNSITPNSQTTALLASLSILLLAPEGKTPMEVLNTLLNQILKLLKCEFAQVMIKKQDLVTKKENFVCISSTESVLAKESLIKNNNFVIYEPNTIFSLSTTKGIAISSDNLENDNRLFPVPKDYPLVKNFISVPLHNNQYSDKTLGQLTFVNLSTPMTQISSPNERGKNIKGLLSSFEHSKEVKTEVDFFSIIIPVLPVFSQLLQLSQRSSITSLDQLREKKNTIDVKDQFLANMSHELRTPFNGIVGIIDLFPTIGPLNEKQREYMSHLTDCTGQLLTLLNNLLDYSKMINNRLSLIQEPFNVYEAINASMNMLELKARDKNIEIRKNISSDLPRVIGDKQRLIQVITNIVGNAIKFSDNNSIITFSMNFSDISQPTDVIKSFKIFFQITDNGIGIPISEQELIFSPYHRTSNLTLFHIKNGTGLGLSISNEIVKLMNGKIDITSEGIKGRGSSFQFFFIAIEVIDVKKFSEPDQKKISKSKILLVDDKSENRMMLTDLIFSWGMFPIAVSSADEALRYIKNKNIKLDIVLIDIFMPHMSGIELAQKSKTIQPELKLIGLSSVEKTDISGQQFFDYFLAKPIDKNRLFSSIMNLILLSKTETETRGIKIKSVQNSSINEINQYPLPPPIIDDENRSLHITTSLSSSEEDEDNFITARGSSDSNDLRIAGSVKIKKAKRDLKILVAEDDINNRWTIKEQLLSMGYSEENITIVEDGQQCIDKVSANGSEFDVILMDIVMPVMDGFEATRYIRKLDKNLMIIAVSAAVQQTDKSKGHQEGIDAYLTKPINRENLESVLNFVSKK